MITEKDFSDINQKVIAAINAAYDAIEKKPDYIIFLADGEYKKNWQKNLVKHLNPYVIDDRSDFWQDETRNRFMIEFLNTFYRFKNEAKAIDDSEIRINMEMMVYSQVWEAIAFLKKLDRLVRMAAGQQYNWKLTVPAMGKHNFILATKEESKKAKLAIWDIINNSFHSQIRNAFAHSDYSIDSVGRRIWFYNYSGKKWELKEISFDDWSKRFSNTILLVHRLIEIHYERRQKLPTENKTHTFKINHPSEKNGVSVAEIEFDGQHNHFNFKQNR